MWSTDLCPVALSTVVLVKFRFLNTGSKTSKVRFSDLPTAFWLVELPSCKVQYPAFLLFICRFQSWYKYFAVIITIIYRIFHCIWYLIPTEAVWAINPTVFGMYTSFISWEFCTVKTVWLGRREASIILKENVMFYLLGLVYHSVYT